jgi:hypothetical protein
MRKTNPEPACPTEVLDWIAWYPEGRLPEALRGAIESHAAECAPCRDEIGLLSGGVEDAAPVPVADPERVFERVRHRIARERAPREVPSSEPAPAPCWTRGQLRRAAFAAGFALALLAAGAAAGWQARRLWIEGAAQLATMPPAGDEDAVRRR